MFRRVSSLIAVFVACMAFVGGTAFAQDSPTRDAYGGEAGSVAGLQDGGGSDPNGGGGASEPTNTTAGDGDLPFTGFQIGLALVLGAGLVGAGFAMRRTVRPQQG